MTEDKAKKLRCCGPLPANAGIMIQSHVDEGGAFDKPRTIYLCSGSECMAWRWEQQLIGMDDEANLIYKNTDEGSCCYRRDI